MFHFLLKWFFSSLENNVEVWILLIVFWLRKKMLFSIWSEKKIVITLSIHHAFQRFHRWFYSRLSVVHWFSGLCCPLVDSGFILLCWLYSGFWFEMFNVVVEFSLLLFFSRRDAFWYSSRFAPLTDLHLSHAGFISAGLLCCHPWKLNMFVELSSESGSVLAVVSPFMFE